MAVYALLQTEPNILLETWWRPLAEQNVDFFRISEIKEVLRWIVRLHARNVLRLGSVELEQEIL